MIQDAGCSGTGAVSELHSHTSVGSIVNKLTSA